MTNSVFGFEQPEDSPGFLLWQTSVVLARSIKEALERYEITHPQFVILAILLWFSEKKQEVTQVLIARQSKLDKMTVSKSLKTLVERELVKRGESKLDSRAKKVCSTPKGKAMAAKLVPIVEKIDEDFFGHVSKTDQKLLITILIKLISNYETKTF